VAYGFHVGRSDQLQKVQGCRKAEGNMHDLTEWVAQYQYLLWTMRKSCMKHSGEANSVSVSTIR